MSSSPPPKKYHLGCPIWANKDWVGKLFTTKAKPKQYLRQYAQVFSTVEGSNTFYGLPRPEMIQRWKLDTPDDFRFSFKFPRTITHDYKLKKMEAEVQQLFKAMEPILPKIGLFFLQLPPSFNKKSIASLEKFIPCLPSNFNYAVEVRHQDFYNEQDADTEKRLNDLLAANQINRALFDTVTLHQIQSRNPEVLAAQNKKPRMPRRLTATGKHPFLRYVGYLQAADNLTALQPIIDQTATWINEGKTPYLFMHTPGDEYAPHLCRLFHQTLQIQYPNLELPNMPPWPFDKEAALPQQLSLF